MTVLRRVPTPLHLIAALLLVTAIISGPQLRAQVERWARQGDTIARLQAGDTDIGNHTTDQFIATAQSRIKRNEIDWQAYADLGAGYLQKVRETGDPSYYGKAEGVLKRSLELQPQNDQALVSMGAHALARHQFVEALDWGQKARALNPYSSLPLGVIGDAQIELGRYDEAFRTMQAMVDMRPDLSSYSRISYALELHGDVPAAITAMKAAVNAGGPNTENTNWTRVTLGNLYFNSGNLIDAEIEYSHALAITPNFVPALAGIAQIHAARGDYPSAITQYRQAIDLMPMSAYVIALSDVYTAAGQPDQAARQDALAQAMIQLFQANGVDSDLDLALFEADRGLNPPATVQRARAAFAKRPSIHGADVLAWSLYRAGQDAEAYDMAHQALRLGTRDALLWFHAGMIADRLGKSDEARTDLQTAIDINPYFSVRYGSLAHQTLARLKMQ